MRFLQRRSLPGLERLSDDAPTPGGASQYPPVGHVAFSDGPALAVAEDTTPQYEFPTSSPDAEATRSVTDPGIASEEIGGQVAPVVAQRGTEPIASLPVTGQT